MKTPRFLLMLPIIVALLLLTSMDCCNRSDCECDPLACENGTFEEVIDQGNDFTTLPQSRTTDTLEVGQAFEEDQEIEDPNGNIALERWVCQTKKVSIQDGNPEFPLFNTNAEVIYPGNLLQGGTLEEVTPSVIPVKRAGGVYFGVSDPLDSEL